MTANDETEKAATAKDEKSWLELTSGVKLPETFSFYAVKSTGVYCRPGCPSRRPARKNVLFFDRREDAERAGYRPCKRCRPQDSTEHEELRRKILSACSDLDTARERLSLESLAAKAGLSPGHFQRLFKATVGVSPSRYRKMSRTKRFKDLLRSGKSVTEAVYAAGFGSSSRAYELARDRLGMSPGDYRRQAEGLVLRYAFVRTEFGELGVAASERGICAMELGKDEEAVFSALKKDFPKARFEAAGQDFSATLRRVVSFLEGPVRIPGLPLDIRGTAFQERVWEVLLRIPPGSTLTYTEVAEKIGEPRAVRAVARACAANKLAVAVPCHRVVRQDGDLAGYKWGIELKRALLFREKEGGGL